jgi:hypothetical protein
MTEKQNKKENRQASLKRYYEKNKERINERNRKYREDNEELELIIKNMKDKINGK